MKYYLILKKEKCMINLEQQIQVKGFGGGAGGPFGGGNGYYSYSSSGGFDGFGDFGDLGDIFSSFFSGGFGGRSSTRNNNGPKQGADLRTNLDITFEESFLGNRYTYS